MDRVAISVICRTILVLALGALVSGCGAERISPSGEDWDTLSTKQSLALKHVSVSIEPLAHESTISSTFTRGVKEADVFKSVALLANPGESPDIILSNYEHIENFPGTGIQCWHSFSAILTVGIIPVVCERSHSILFVAKNSRGQFIQIKGEFKRKRIVGWAALLLRMSSNWSMDNDDTEWNLGPAYERYMRDLLISRAEELTALAEQPN